MNRQNLEKTLGQVCVQEFKFLVTVLSHGRLKVSTQWCTNGHHQLSFSFENHYQVFQNFFSFHCCHSVKRKLTTISRQLCCLATQHHILIPTCLWSGLIESDYVKPVTRVVCHFWNANKTILSSQVSRVIDVKIYSNIIHFPLCFSGIDVISFHALLHALKELKKTWCFLSFKESKESVFYFPSELESNNLWNAMNSFNQCQPYQ